jgi:putative transposase
MPRRPRLVLPNIPLHIIQRGNNRQNCFYAKQDFHLYLEWLEKYAKETGCAVHAYVMMTNHVHLLITPQRSESAGQMMKKLGQRYVQYVNRTYQRSGTLWEGRYRSCLIQGETYFYTCHRYIELNPVRAKLVSDPAEYPWSSYLANGYGIGNNILSPHQLYMELGGDAVERQVAYRELFRYELGADVIDKIRNSTNGNYVLGDSRFAEQVEAKLGRRATPGMSGRPKRDP